MACRRSRSGEDDYLLDSVGCCIADTIGKEISMMSEEMRTSSEAYEIEVWALCT